MHFPAVQPGCGRTVDSQRSCCLERKRLLREEEEAFEKPPHCPGSQGSFCGPVSTYWWLALSSASCKCRYHIPFPLCVTTVNFIDPRKLAEKKYNPRKAHLAVEPPQGFELFWFWPVREKLNHGGHQQLLSLGKAELLVLQTPGNRGVDQHLPRCAW